jgi:hypothetical protein
MYSVVRAKDERLNIVKDALGLFKNRPMDKMFTSERRSVAVWDEDYFEMAGAKANIRFLKFVETWTTSKGKVASREMWCITTLPKSIDAQTVWMIMRKRWDIENNGFRMLKTYFHADHCYVHGKGADEKILLLIIIAFNLMELFLFRRLNEFRQMARAGKITRKHLIDVMWDDLLLESYAQYYETG